MSFLTFQLPRRPSSFASSFRGTSISLPYSLRHLSSIGWLLLDSHLNVKLSKILLSSHWLFSNKFFRWYKYARPITVHIPRLRRRLRVASSLLATCIASTTVFINHWHCIFCLSFCLCPRLSVYTRLLLPRVRRLRVASSLLGLHLLLSSSITGTVSSVSLFWSASLPSVLRLLDGYCVSLNLVSSSYYFD